MFQTRNQAGQFVRRSVARRNYLVLYLAQRNRARRSESGSIPANALTTDSGELLTDDAGTILTET